MKKSLLTLVIAVWLTPAMVSAAPISSIYVFGDSLSDQGNAFLLSGGTFPPPPYAARASDGPVAVEWMASALGVTLAPAVLGGTNYAVMGAATGPVVIAGTDPPVSSDNISATTYGVPALAGTGMLNQVTQFLTTAPAFAPDSTLFVVWGGPNDVFLNPSAETAQQAVGNLSTMIGALYAAGARQFLVPNMPNLALTPFGLALPFSGQVGLQQLSLGFNAGLGSALDVLDQLPGMDIVRFDAFGLLTAISGSPGTFGLHNVTTPCLTGDPWVGFDVCATPETYLFWDTAHPSARGHMILGDAFARAVAPATVPEPALLTLLLVGVAARAAGRRRAS